MMRIYANALVPAALALTLVACGSTPEPGFDTTSSDVTLSANAQAAYSFFVGKGLTSCQAAGIVGNLEQESNIDPTIAQYGGGPGRGIAQWSTGGRWDTEHDDNVVWYAQQHGQSQWSLGLQLDFVWYELQSFSNYGLSSLRGSSTLSAATVAFQNDFEGCGTCDQSNRIAYAQAALDAYGNGTCGAGGGSSSSGGSGSGSGSGGGSSGGSGSSSGGSSAAWTGSYACQVTTSADITQPAIGNQSGSGTGTVRITQSGSNLTADIQGQAGVTCTLHLTASGDSASVDPGQSCSAMTTLVAAVVNGSVTLSGNQLGANLSLDLSGTDQGQKVVGTAVEKAACTRQ